MNRPVIVALVLLQPQLRLALDYVHAFETRIGLALVPSVVILVVVLLLYFQARRHEQRLQRSVGDVRNRERRGRDSVPCHAARQRACTDIFH